MSKDNSLVDGGDLLPRPEGCGESFSFIINPVVANILKLPSEDGNNTAILNGWGARSWSKRLTAKPEVLWEACCVWWLFVDSTAWCRVRGHVVSE